MNIKTPGFSVSREKGDMGKISAHLEEPCEVISSNMGECEYILQCFITSICPFCICDALHHTPFVHLTPAHFHVSLATSVLHKTHWPFIYAVFSVSMHTQKWGGVSLSRVVFNHWTLELVEKKCVSPCILVQGLTNFGQIQPICFYK